MYQCWTFKENNLELAEHVQIASSKISMSKVRQTRKKKTIEYSVCQKHSPEEEIKTELVYIACSKTSMSKARQPGKRKQ